MQASVHFLLGLLLFINFGSNEAPTKVLDSGFNCVKIGDPMLAKEIRKWKGLPVKDTMFSKDGYVWRVSMVSYPQGKVYFEEDFHGKGQINRIRIESPDISFGDSLRVGSPARDLSSFTGEWEIALLDYYLLYDVSPVQFPSIHFLIEAKEKDIWDTATQIECINPLGKVVAIVVM